MTAARRGGRSGIAGSDDRAAGDATVPDGFAFALCLTHDVDRVHKTYQAPYYALKDRRPYHLKTLVSGEAPYWQFDTIMAVEEAFDVRSSFYFLNEKRLFRDAPMDAWIRPRNWVRYAGRPDIEHPAMRAVIGDLDAGGWEIGLHGSYDSYDDPDRLQYEKDRLEQLVGHEILGGRQHYLNLRVPESWEHHEAVGLSYDASLGSNAECGFRYGHGVRRPFGDEFVVFPLTVMDTALMARTSGPAEAWSRCEALLRRARENRAVMTVLFHQRVFNEREFPGYARVYRRLIETAQSMGAWVGPCGDLYEHYAANHNDR